MISTKQKYTIDDLHKDMRGLVKYAKEKGVAPIDLTQEEKERFMMHLAVSEERRTLGIANGKYFIPDDIDECNDEIAEMFGIKEL